MKKLYEYDIKRGHYYLIKEADGDSTMTSNVTTDTDKTSTTTTTTSTTTATTNASVETNSEIQQINTDLQAELKRYQNSKKSIEDTYNTNKQAQTDLINAAMQAAGTTTSTGQYDPVQTNANVLSLKKKLLDLELKHAQDLNRVELEHATKVNAIENNRLQILSKLNNEGWNRVPEKYRKFINEGKIADIKIYMNGLVEDDEFHIIRDINDMKAAFESTGLPYGKDKHGFYALCVDKDDLTVLYETLIHAGYSKDEIYSNIYPQTI